MSSLISNDALPDWIRAAPSPTPMPTAPWGSQPAAGAVPWGVTPPPMGQSSALFDDAALPDWLRAAAAGQAPAGDPANGGGYAPTPPSASPLAGAYNGRMALPPSPYDPPGAPSPFQSAPQPPANGYGNGYANGYDNGYGNGPANAPAMSAGPSLFDAAALPAWLGGSASSSMPLVTEPPAGAGNMAANTLVDPNVLPQWMRDAPAPRPDASAPPQASTVSQWLASPVTDEPLPGFLDQIYAEAEVPRLDPAAPLAALGGEPIVDARALPSWLRAPGDGRAAQGTDWGGAGFGAAESMPLPPPVMPPAPGYGAPGTPPVEDFGAAPRFSAKDLVEPDALPAWAQPSAGPEMGQVPPAFALDAAPLNAPSDAPRWPDQDAGQDLAQGFAQGFGQEYGQAAQLPRGNEASQPGKSWPPRGDQPSIPAAELPPWLREGQPAAVAGAPDGYAGIEEFHGFDAGAMPMDPDDALDQPFGMPDEPQVVEHYSDRFGNERPGIGSRFGYEYDYGQEVAPVEEPAPISTGHGGQNRKGGKRRGLFRRR